MIYHVYFRNIPVIDIVTDKKNQVIRWKKFVKDSPRQPFWGENITRERLYTFLKSRCFEDNRPDLKELLAYHGLTSNNPYQWCKVTHGVMHEDYFWIRYDDEDITWEEVRIR